METGDRELVADISQSEVKLLIKALNKSVDNYNTRRHYIFALAAGLIIGGCFSAFFAIYIFNHNEKKQFVCADRLKKYDEAIKRLKEIDLKISSLTEHTKSILNQTDMLHMYAPDMDALGLNGLDQVTEKEQEKSRPVLKECPKNNYGKYRVYIHCAGKKDNEQAGTSLYHFLTKKGYSVGAIQYVKSENNDIRYFNNDDRDAAFALKKNVRDFISKAGRDLNLKVVYLGRAYPDTAAGQLELWISPDY